MSHPITSKTAGTALVVTSIHPPNAVMHELASGCLEHGWNFILAGDSKSPAAFELEGCRFLSLDAQRRSEFLLPRLAPEKSYTRKNTGYLTAIQGGAKVIVETDDDNHPMESFWQERDPMVRCRPVEADGWVNAYRYFTEDFIYPRGMPLPRAQDAVPATGEPETLECPIQQGLADEDPDVDAVYRMLFPQPFRFQTDEEPVLLRGNAWCPFNSQNTTFFEDSFPLLYLPACCSFRMTDIWRGFVAQRVLHEKGFGILFHGPTVWQDRNPHDLQRDFSDELPGYLHNARMREILLGIDIRRCTSTRVMMELCYEALIRNGWVESGEIPLLNAWFDDLESCNMILS